MRTGAHSPGHRGENHGADAFGYAIGEARQSVARLGPAAARAGRACQGSRAVRDVGRAKRSPSVSTAATIAALLATVALSGCGADYRPGVAGTKPVLLQNASSNSGVQPAGSLPR